MSQVRVFPLTTASHVGRMDVDKKPRCGIFKPKFPHKTCKGDHINHLCPAILEVQRIWSSSDGSSIPGSIVVSQQTHQPLVDEVVESMKSLVNSTPLLGGKVPNKKAFFIYSTYYSGLGGIPVSSNVPPSSSRSFFFDWDNLIEPRLLFHCTFPDKG